MSITYIERDVASDLGGGADFSDSLSLSTASGGLILPSIAALSTEESYFYSPVGIPSNPAWQTGDWTVKFRFGTGGGGVLMISMRVDRVNSAGTLQQSSSATTEQLHAVSSTQTHSLTALAWSGGAVGDRFRIALIARNPSVAAATYRLGLNTAPDTVVTPVLTQVQATGSMGGMASMAGAVTGAAALAGASRGSATAAAPSSSRAVMTADGRAGSRAQGIGLLLWQATAHGDAGGRAQAASTSSAACTASGAGSARSQAASASQAALAGAARASARCQTASASKAALAGSAAGGAAASGAGSGTSSMVAATGAGGGAASASGAVNLLKLMTAAARAGAWSRAVHAGKANMTASARAGSRANSNASSLAAMFGSTAGGASGFANPEAVEAAAIGCIERIVQAVRDRWTAEVEIAQSLAVLHDNEPPENMDELDLWVRFTVEVVPTTQMVLGAIPEHRYLGTATARIFLHMGLGDADALDLADAINHAFRSVEDDEIVYFPPPSAVVRGRTGVMWEVDVSIPFYSRCAEAVLA